MRGHSCGSNALMFCEIKMFILKRLHDMMTEKTTALHGIFQKVLNSGKSKIWYQNEEIWNNYSSNGYRNHGYGILGVDFIKNVSGNIYLNT